MSEQDGLARNAAVNALSAPDGAARMVGWSLSRLPGRPDVLTVKVEIPAVDGDPLAGDAPGEGGGGLVAP